MTVTEHGADFDGEFLTTVAAFEQFAVCEFIRLYSAAVRAVAVSTIFAPTLDF